jgi:hypothetical protein
MELFSLRKIRRICPRHRGRGPPAPAHRSMNFIKRRLLASGSTAQIDPSELLSWFLISTVHHRSDDWDGWFRPKAAWARARARGGVSRLSAVASQSSSFLKLRWSVFDEVCSYRIKATRGNMFMLTLIGGERQWSPATVRRLGRCLVMVRVASGEASAPRTCAKASSSSLPASQPTNWSDQRRKTRIWWLRRVQRVLDLRPKIHTICDTIYRGF